MSRRSLPQVPRGVILLYGLIALAIMLIGAVAMVRSMNTSLVNAGNMGFKRDLTNQGERAMATVLALMQTGALATEVVRQSHSAARNYRATLLPPNPQGLPEALLSNALFDAIATAGNDITVADMGVTVRYVVDRMCVNTGLADSSHCTMAEVLEPPGSSAGVAGPTAPPPPTVVYRLSIRIEGPRQTQAFFQSTFTIDNPI